MGASVLATQALHGLVYGMLLFLIASGLTLVFGMMRILNMAHASFYMLGAYIACTIGSIAGFWAALVAAPLLVGMIGMLTERFLLRRVDRNSHVLDLLLTFGLFYVFGEAVLWIWGSFPLQLEPPPALSGSIPLLGARYPLYRLFILAISAMVCGALAFALLRTRLGITIRSVVSDGGMASALGVDVSRVRFGVFGAGAAMAALAGAIAAPVLQAEPTMAASALVDAFVVVVVGGFGSVFGTFIAALLLGQLQSLGVLFAPDFAIVFQFLMMAAVLILRPQGLFGEAS